MIDISADRIELSRMMLGHIPGALPKVLSRTINRAVTGARADATRQAKAEYTVSAGTIRNAIGKPRLSNVSNLTASIRARGGTVPLSSFKITPSKPLKRRSASALQAIVKPGSGGTIKGAFVARMKEVGFGGTRRALESEEGHVGVFVRQKGKFMRGQGPRPKKRGSGNTKGREAIKEIYGPSVAQMLGNPTVNKYIEDGINQRIDSRLSHEINRILRGVGR
jgi:hypothetical protein